MAVALAGGCVQWCVPSIVSFLGEMGERAWNLDEGAARVKEGVP